MSNNIKEAGAALIAKVKKKIPDAMQKAGSESEDIAKKAGEEVMRMGSGGFHVDRWVKAQESKHETAGTTLSVHAIATNEVGSFDYYDKRYKNHGIHGPGNEWVSHLIWEEGIWGLPATSEVWPSQHNGQQWSGYWDWTEGHNNLFHQLTPLQQIYETGNSYWDGALRQIADIVISNLKF